MEDEEQGKNERGPSRRSETRNGSERDKRESRKPRKVEKSRGRGEEKFWLRKKRKSVGPCRKPTHSGLWSCVINDDDDDD